MQLVSAPGGISAHDASFHPILNLILAILSLIFVILGLILAILGLI